MERRCKKTEKEDKKEKGSIKKWRGKTLEEEKENGEKEDESEGEEKQEQK